MIHLSKVQKKFGQRLAVDDLTLTVPRGEIFGLLGHNGAGKSTAIGMMLRAARARARASRADSTPESELQRQASASSSVCSPS